MGQIVKRVSKDGKITYSARVRRRGATPVYGTFSRASDAKAWLDEEERKIRLGIQLAVPEASKRTLAEAIDRFILENNPPRYYSYPLECFRKALGDNYLANVDEIKINDYLARLKVVGSRPGRKPPSLSTLNRYLVALSILFRHARDWGWTKTNPVRDAKRYKEPRGVIRFLDEEERARLLKACQEDEYKPLHLIVVLAISTGMRKGELMSLTWKQIDLATGTIILTRTKNGECRRVNARGLALDLLREHAKVRRIDSLFLFPGEKDSPEKECKKVKMSDRYFYINKPWLRTLKRAQIENFRFHDLRHTCASYLAMHGASHLEIAEVLGHKTLAMVKRYSHLADSHTASLVEAMNKRIFGG